MAKVFVKLPVGMTTPDGHGEVECDAATVGEALTKAIAVEPRMRRASTVRTAACMPASS